MCYDTGGINLKSANSMKTMKHDMAGSATALAAFMALVEDDGIGEVGVGVVAVILHRPVIVDFYFCIGATTYSIIMTTLKQLLGSGVFHVCTMYLCMYGPACVYNRTLLSYVMQHIQSIEVQAVILSSCILFSIELQTIPSSAGWE